MRMIMRMITRVIMNLIINFDNGEFSDQFLKDKMVLYSGFFVIYPI